MLRRIIRSAIVIHSVFAVATLGAQRPVAADISVSADAKGNAALSRPVTVTLDQVPFREALRNISVIARDVGIAIQYRAQVVNPVTKSVTLRALQMPLGQVLGHVLAGTRLQVVPFSNMGVTIVPVNGDAPNARQDVIRGVVTDATTQRPVSGVTVAVEGTQVVARTDAQGVFVLTGVPPGTYTLAIRRLGYRVGRRDIIVPERGSVTADIQLAVAGTPLDEVVTTVTGPQRRAELGHVVSVLNADSLVKVAPITTVSQLLAARVPGLVVTQGQGTVGGDVTLQIRGKSSLTLSTEPIVIVDGIRYSSRAASKSFSSSSEIIEPVSPLNDLNPNDIETVEVVKGPAAATLYGTDASNGVIVITTKRGKPGPARWNAYGLRSRSQIPRPRDDAFNRAFAGWKTYPGAGENGEDLVFFNCRIMTLCVPDSVTSRPSVLANNEFSLFQKGDANWTTGVNVSGGTAAMRYYLSGSYDLMDSGIRFPDTAVKLVEAARGERLRDEMRRPNTDERFNVLPSVTAALGPLGDVTIRGGYTRGETRRFAANLTSLGQMVRGGYDEQSAINNALEEMSSSVEINNRWFGAINAQSRLTPWLTMRGDAGLDAATRNTSGFRDHMDPTLRRVTEDLLRQTATTGNGGATLTLQRGRLRSNTSVGVNYVRTLADATSIFGFDLVPGTSSLRFAGTTQSTPSFFESVTLGGYVEETFGLNERFFLTGGLRSDGGSGFGSGYHAATYPKLSMSWLLTREPWVPRLPVLDEVRLRTAWGLSGSQAPYTAHLADWKIANAQQYTGTGQRFFFSNIGNPNLGPERVREIETGIDADLWQQRATVELTWAKRRTNDLIIEQELPAGYGKIKRNIALVTGRSFESMITARLIETQPFALTLLVRHSEQRTKVVDLGAATPNRAVSGGYDVGTPIGAIFTRPVLGFEDVNGDNIIVPNEIQLAPEGTYAGVSAPTVVQGLTPIVGFFGGQLRVSANFDRQLGAKRVLNLSCYECRVAFDTTTPLRVQALYVAAANPGSSARPVVSADFTRLRELTASVVLPPRWLRAFRVQSGSFALSATNLALWTKYKSGIGDPEGRIGKAGFDYSIPQNRTWVTRFDFSL